VAALGGLADAAIYAAAGLGIQHKWRSAAVVGLLLFLANAALSVVRGGGVGVLAIFIFVGFVNAVRGTFAHARLMRLPLPESAG
jgi:hypothetical protein